MITKGPDGTMLVFWNKNDPTERVNEWGDWVRTSITTYQKNTDGGIELEAGQGGYLMLEAVNPNPVEFKLLLE